jgi:hypothetical protein
MTTPIREDGGRPHAVRWRRLGIEVELTHQAGHREPGAVLNRDARVGTHAALASGHRKALPRQLLARLLGLVPGFTSKLEQPEVMFL